MKNKHLISGLIISCILFSGCNKLTPTKNVNTTCDTTEQVIATTFSETTEQTPATTSEVSFENTTEQIVTEAIATEAFATVDEDPSLKRLLKTAFLPVGHTMYIWGGGWNEEDTAAGIEAITIGVSPRWAEYAAMQDSTYNYKNTYYQIHDGLDCSGYIGWLIYNIFPEKEDGYVMKATKMAQTFSTYGWGSYTPCSNVVDWKRGDIMSMSGHVWLVLSECDDGSVLLLHSSPPGVRVCGTMLPSGAKGASQAEQLAIQIMSVYYPDWYERYPNCSVNYNYLTDSNQFRWSEETFKDIDEIANMDTLKLMEMILE